MKVRSRIEQKIPLTKCCEYSDVAQYRYKWASQSEDAEYVGVYLEDKSSRRSTRGFHTNHDAIVVAQESYARRLTVEAVVAPGLM